LTYLEISARVFLPFCKPLLQQFLYERLNSGTDFLSSVRLIAAAFLGINSSSKFGILIVYHKGKIMLSYLKSFIPEYKMRDKI